MTGHLDIDGLFSVNWSQFKLQSKSIKIKCSQYTCFRSVKDEWTWHSLIQTLNTCLDLVHILNNSASKQFSLSQTHLGWVWIAFICPLATLG